MRISDWSSDVCSSDLSLRCSRASSSCQIPLLRQGAGLKHCDRRSSRAATPRKRAAIRANFQKQRFKAIEHAEQNVNREPNFRLLKNSVMQDPNAPTPKLDRKSTRLNSSH